MRASTQQLLQRPQALASSLSIISRSLKRRLRLQALRPKPFRLSFCLITPRKDKKEGVALLQDPRYADKLSADDLKQIKNILSQGIVIDEYEEICGGSEHALDVVEACHFLEERGYNPQIILAENELDITATINGKTYCGSLRIEPSITYRIMKTEILAEQRKANIPVGLFVYIPDQDTLCFYEIDFDLVNWEQENHRLNNYIQL